MPSFLCTGANSASWAVHGFCGPQCPALVFVCCTCLSVMCPGLALGLLTGANFGAQQAIGALDAGHVVIGRLSSLPLAPFKISDVASELVKSDSWLDFLSGSHC